VPPLASARPRSVDEGGRPPCVASFFQPPASGFVSNRIGFVFDVVKSPIDTHFCSNLKNLLALCLEHVFPKLASFGAFRVALNCQIPASRSGFSLTIAPRPRATGWKSLTRWRMETGHPTTNTLSARMISKNRDPIARRRKNSSNSSRESVAAKAPMHTEPRGRAVSTSAHYLRGPLRFGNSPRRFSL
jgi:hypothetical protein